MIQYLLLQNRQGKTRLSKYYRAYTDEERNKIESDVHRIVTTRDPKFTNFVEVIACSHKNGAFAQPPPKHRAVRSPPSAQYTQYKLIYRRYAGLFFTLCVDVSDNELLYFESIHLFVELLDQFFGNVCELDLVFNFNKARRPPLSAPPCRPFSPCTCAPLSPPSRIPAPLVSGIHDSGRVLPGGGGAGDLEASHPAPRPGARQARLDPSFEPLSQQPSAWKYARLSCGFPCDV